MFYSHEVLTSRKYGVATIWLVATLGQKSALKKVSRKQILEVDVPKACETIVTPEAPMALRLQSNLLYGVARVYSQQCGYVLSDAENARNNLCAVYKVMRTSALDAEGGHKGRGEQLLLQDDPNFLPDFDLVDLDFDNLNQDMASTRDSQRFSLSPHSSHLTIDGSQQTIGGLVIPASASSLVGGPVGGIAGLNTRGDSGVSRYEDGLLLDDDAGIEVLPDGTMRISEVPSIKQSGAARFKGERVDLGSSSSTFGRTGEGGQPGATAVGHLRDNGSIAAQDEDDNSAEIPHVPSRQNGDVQPQITSTSETADVPLRRRARAAPKVIPIDNTIELRNSDLARWSTDYVANMNEALHHKQAARITALAKKNAEYWVLGPGSGPFDISDRGPLSMFTGARLLEALTGRKLTIGGEKRGREDGDDLGHDRPKRSRATERSPDEIGRGLQDDGYMPIIGDETDVEYGREQPTPLDDRHLSSTFPWNQSTASRRPTALFSAGQSLPASGSLGGGFAGLLSRRGSRLVSASPLIGRGAAAARTMDDLALPSSQDGLVMTGAEAFELYGPAAQVDTQTAAQSNWQHTILDAESLNFLSFVQAGIDEIHQMHEQAGMDDEDDEGLKGLADFETLLPPESNSRVVAAQAFLHVLTLGTRNLLKVEQEDITGAISLRVLAAPQ